MFDGKALRDAIISGSNSINNYRKNVDALNVFPVPDGDTGTNMSMTMSAAAREAARLRDEVSAGEAASVAASALLRGARGNSGVILSLIFRGFASGVKGLDKIDGAHLAAALKLGTESAYNAVMKPTEGTILTVVRRASEKAAEAAAAGKSAPDVFSDACAEAEKALAETPEILPVLKRAGVVDAGGQGLVYVFKGMRSVFTGNGITDSLEGGAEVRTQAKSAKTAEDIRFTYCTEFLIDKNPEVGTSPVKLRAYLESIGDCVVVVDDDSVIKVHCHSNEPGNVIQNALHYGQLINIKIENMREQHENASWGAVADGGEPLQLSDGGGTAEPAPETKPAQDEYREPFNAETVSAEPVKDYGIVAVAVGAGVEEIFREIGVDALVSGGQTMNPSTDDILRAVESTPAKEVFILPNNKNIIMSAEQVAPLSDKIVRVLHTRTIPEGITAALAFDPDVTGEENHVNMMKAAEAVSTVQVTFAARDSRVGNEDVKKGQILGMENGKITVIENSPVQAAYKAVRHLVKKNTSVITVYRGEGMSEEQGEELCSLLGAKLGDSVDVSQIEGGQPVYYFIISIE